MIPENSPLFAPFQLGDLLLSNRMVMAPLTRNRAIHATGAPSALNAEYYAQRAAAGLLISEATQISQQGQGYAWTPGIYSQAQASGWKMVTEAVHEAGGKIFLQLWHVGRISHTSLQPGHGAPVAPSAIRARAKTFIESGFVDVSEPRALETSEIAGIVNDFALAAANAKQAGFDGVEVHAANGYLLDQFMRDGANKRTDMYGGSIENRLRLTLQVVDAAQAIFPSRRVGIRISPVSPAGDCADSDPPATFGALARALSSRNMAYLHVIEGATGGPRDSAPFDYAALRAAFGGTYMANNGYNRDMAMAALASGTADLVSFGVPFLANPDLVERFRTGAPLNKPDHATFYGGDAKGYTDYPFLRAQAA